MGNDIIYLRLDFKLNENTGAGMQCSENSKMKGLQNLDWYQLTVQLTGCPCKSKVLNVMHISCSISSNIRTSLSWWCRVLKEAGCRELLPGIKKRKKMWKDGWEN